MKNLFLAGLAVASLFLVGARAEARGGKGSSCGGGVYSCASACDASAWCAPAAPVSYQTVTAYRCEVRTRVVPRQVTRYEYNTVNDTVKYTVMEQVVTPTKQTQTYYETVSEQQPYSYQVMKPVMRQRVVQQASWSCVPETVAQQVPVCRMVSSCVVDPCTGCVRNVCQPVTEMQTVTRTVMKPVMTTQNVTVNYCEYVAETVNSTRTVYRQVPRSQEVTVNVVSCQPVEKTGTVQRVVATPKTETVNVTEYYTEQVPYTYQVPVYGSTCGGCGTVASVGGCGGCY